ncbi:MAG: hypothetical protein ABFS14_04065 [Gemmatimonadota bacterium]
MKYMVICDTDPADVLRQAKDFFAAHSRMTVADESAGAVHFTGDGNAHIHAAREYSHTHVHAETDRVAGLDVTDLTKRFLYTLGHV